MLLRCYSVLQLKILEAESRDISGGEISKVHDQCGVRYMDKS